ncbi:MAG: NAD(P)-dependent oxidoreductase [Prevotellaceae bacterium]|nr:NAD(P)-dependent oxidoreductase [Candidatus Faecinaster equi]
MSKGKILITGASGFVGSFLVEEALQQDYEVWAAIRPTSSRKYLQDNRIHILEIHLNDRKKLYSELSVVKEQIGLWNYVFHVAGVTKAKDKTLFMKTNYEATKVLVETLCSLNMIPQKFVMMSSLSVLGNIKEEKLKCLKSHVYPELTSIDIPKPNTIYGKSKLRAEEYLLNSNLPIVILRPTGVYGPREKDYMMMVDCIKKHFDFAVGYKCQEITFIYVKDLAKVALKAVERGVVGKTYLLSDGNTYKSSDFSKLIQKELGIKIVFRFIIPLFVVKWICYLSQIITSLTGKVNALNIDKYNILKQRNWRCNIDDAINDLGYEPKYNLERGVKETILWYKNNL